MPSTSESKLQLYAELLPNILQIRLFLIVPVSTIPTPSNAESTSLTPDGPSSELSLDLSNSRSSITVSYHNQKLSLQLPVPVSEKSRESLKARDSSPITSNSSSTPREKEYSFRLPIDRTSASIARAAFEEHQGPQIPWTAKDMSPQSRIRCRKCGSLFLTPTGNNGFVWKDLPSADWAEMMDLWHCHKPDTHEDDKPANEGHNGTSNSADDTNETVKGYGAANRVVCASGTIFVNVSSFIIAEDDCTGLNKVVRIRSSPHFSIYPSLLRFFWGGISSIVLLWFLFCYSPVLFHFCHSSKGRKKEIESQLHESISDTTAQDQDYRHDTPTFLIPISRCNDPSGSTDIYFQSDERVQVSEDRKESLSFSLSPPTWRAFSEERTTVL